MLYCFSYFSKHYGWSLSSKSTESLEWISSLHWMVQRQFLENDKEASKTVPSRVRAADESSSEFAVACWWFNYKFLQWICFEKDQDRSASLLARLFLLPPHGPSAEFARYNEREKETVRNREKEKEERGSGGERGTGKDKDNEMRKRQWETVRVREKNRERIGKRQSEAEKQGEGRRKTESHPQVGSVSNGVFLV